MKRITILAIFLLTVSIYRAQGDEYGWRTTYNNLGYINTTMLQEGIPNLKSNCGISYTTGTTYYLHAPIAGFLRLGIDVTWFDINYTNYKIKHITYQGTNTYKYHQGEVSMHIGPSLSLQFGWLNIHGYFRYAPAYSVMYANDSLSGNYSTFFVGGASISYGAIGLGVESRFGGCDYKTIFEDIEGYAGPISANYKGLKAYLTFRF